MELIGTAGRAGAAGRRPFGGAVDSATGSMPPQLPHSGQRPSHFAQVFPHSEQRYSERALEVLATR
ncbi:hypothetical protein JDM601_3877 [Mycolicibacter sinensis]|uniref:Uncharacterized protein n=2 Tax=Mycobacteriaceae TaxID=1762 RepID=F5YS79_MYCSD|nr:hypothetical protein JDM601_3877 [Mycolicibacter sinensis]BBX13239.1 hypothetical protein MNVM_23200 [Mycobacterium novum]